MSRWKSNRARASSRFARTSTRPISTRTRPALFPMIRAADAISQNNVATAFTHVARQGARAAD